MDDKWRVVSCPRCGGHGVTWNPESWFGAEECYDCGEGGQLWIRPKGHTFQYPGGPATGMWDEKAYARGVPQMPYQYHAWTNTDKEVDEFITDRLGNFDQDLNKIICACGFSGSLREHETHAEEAKKQFILEHQNV